MLLNRNLRLNLANKLITSDANSLICSTPKIAGVFLNRRQSTFTNLITKDVSKIFFAHDAQKLMKQITEFDLDKIYRPRAVGSFVKPPRHAFMTTQELKRVQAKAIQNAYEKLQIPPIVPVSSNEVEVLDSTPQLVGFSKSKIVFTDISYGVSDKKRLIVVREPSGVLRKALPSERHRMNEIYFSREGRMLQHPRMFEKENLESLWDRGEFEFILNRACCQFEPDDVEFHEVTFSTYEKVNEAKAFQQLRSTRHFGSMAFYLCLRKNLDNLIEENLNTGRLNEAVKIVELFSMVNVDSDFNKLDANPSDKSNYLKTFLETESSNKNKLIDLLETYVEEAVPVHSNVS